MINEKTIKESARDYINKNGYVGIESAYSEGAKWAINKFLKDLWHDASEVPDDISKKDILEEVDFIDTYIYFRESINAPLDLADRKNKPIKKDTWNRYVKLNRINRWLYIDDLLSKKGTKNDKRRSET